LEKDSKVYVAGEQTLIGAAILRQLERQGYTNIVGKVGEEPELTDARAVDDFFAHQAPEYVFVAAGKSGGIRANQKYPAEFMLDNLLVECHVIHNAYRHGVKKLLYLASSCVYPKHCPQPMRVESVMTGPLEPTNERLIPWPRSPGSSCARRIVNSMAPILLSGYRLTFLAPATTLALRIRT
jgi:GDP-L-fucose synthase